MSEAVGSPVLKTWIGNLFNKLGIEPSENNQNKVLSHLEELKKTQPGKKQLTKDEAKQLFSLEKEADIKAKERTSQVLGRSTQEGKIDFSPSALTKLIIDHKNDNNFITLFNQTGNKLGEGGQGTYSQGELVILGYFNAKTSNIGDVEITSGNYKGFYELKHKRGAFENSKEGDFLVKLGKRTAEQTKEVKDLISAYKVSLSYLSKVLTQEGSEKYIGSTIKSMIENFDLKNKTKMTKELQSTGEITAEKINEFFDIIIKLKQNNFNFAKIYAKDIDGSEDELLSIK